MAYLGIDVSKKTLDCCLLIDLEEVFFKVDNDEKGFYIILDKIKQYKKIHICLEATSSYWLELVDFFYDREFKISVENPAKIFYFAKAVLARAKTDKKDAGLIAKYCQTMQPALYIPVSEEIVKLRKLVDILKTIKVKKTSEEVRLEAASAEIKTLIESNIDFYDKQILNINQMFKDFFLDYPFWGEKRKKLESVPGVGFQTASILLSILASHHFLNSAKFVAFLGLNPKLKQSGTSVRSKERISKMGKSFYRSALFMPAMAAYSHNFYPSFIKKMKDKNKPTKIIIVGLMRKIAVYAFTVFSSDCKFELKNLDT